MCYACMDRYVYESAEDRFSQEIYPRKIDNLFLRSSQKLTFLLRVAGTSKFNYKHIYHHLFDTIRGIIINCFC